jgi:hypothetical protein
MGLKQSLDSRGVSGIDDLIISTIESVATPIIMMSLMPPPIPPNIASIPIPIAPASMGQSLAAAISAQTNSTPADAPGMNIIGDALTADINATVFPMLAAGAVSLNIKPIPGPPVPPSPISPIMLAAPPFQDENALKFGRALLDWACGLLVGDMRIAGKFIVIPPM